MLMVQELLWYWYTFAGGGGVCAGLQCRLAIYQICNDSFFGFRTMHLFICLIRPKIKICSVLTMALNATMMANPRRFWRLIRYSRRCNFLFILLFKRENELFLAGTLKFVCGRHCSVILLAGHPAHSFKCFTIIIFAGGLKIFARSAHHMRSLHLNEALAGAFLDLVV